MTLIVLTIGLLVGSGVVALVVIGIVMLVRKNSGHSITTSSTVDGHDASMYQPLVITAGDLQLSGPVFISKYKNALISFNGRIKETSTVANAKVPHTVLLVGDDAEKGSLTDGTEFWLTSSPTAFSNDLQEFANNTMPNDTKTYPKVSVTAKVVGYSEMYQIISLEPIANENGVTPSVKSR